MQKKYIVRLSEEERCELQEVIKELKGSSQKVRHAQILLKADIEGANWTDERIAEADVNSFLSTLKLSCGAALEQMFAFTLAQFEETWLQHSSIT